MTATLQPLDDEKGQDTHSDVYGRRYASLAEALREHGIPLENHVFIRTFTDAVGIDAYYGTTSYIKAIRSGTGPDLNIAYGWSNGFISQEEARAVAGPHAQAWPSSRGTEQWGVSHPVHRGHDSSGRGTTAHDRDYGTCLRCFTRRAANGTCLCDE